MTDFTNFRSGLQETARQLSYYRGGNVRLTMSGFNWSQLLLGIVGLIDQLEAQKADIGALSVAVGRLSYKIKKPRGKRKATHKARRT